MTTPQKRWFHRLLAAIVIATIASLLAIGAGAAPGLGYAVVAIDHAVYDAAFRARPAQDQGDSPVLLVQVDDDSLKEVSELYDATWPWPRRSWGIIAEYLQDAGARAVALDLLFSETSARGREDDESFGHSIDASSIPMVSAVVGKDGRFVIPHRRDIRLGDTDISQDKVYRVYRPTTARGESLALAAVRAAGIEPKLPADQPFLLHYYGPHRDDAGAPTFTSIKASRVLAGVTGDGQIDPGLFKDKIVLIGTTAAALHDLKEAPVASRYPGMEVHATAILNLIRGQSVRAAPAWLVYATALLLALVTAGVVVLPRSASIKALGVLLLAGTMIALSFGLMQLDAMRWLGPTVPMIALLTAAVGGLVWSYRIEDARARLLLRALSQCISPDVARELANDPTRLDVGGRKQELTLLFTDLDGFTQLTERLHERIAPVLNTYLAEMSQQALGHNGTIDKYIGDAMMVFWNAPLDQPNHARQACETALALVAHERRIAPRLAELGASDIRTRVGIHTGEVVVGFFGSRQRLSYTAIGDTVNLAARLEPANKLYGTQILVSRQAADRAGDGMLFRPVDQLRVYGRREPVTVLELMTRRDQASPAQLWLAEASHSAWAAYLSRDWTACLARIDEILARFPGDGLATTWQRRVAHFQIQAPPTDWDGVFEATTK